MHRGWLFRGCDRTRGALLQRVCHGTTRKAHWGWGMFQHAVSLWPQGPHHTVKVVPRLRHSSDPHGFEDPLPGIPVPH
jgi:hypothetical protein